MRYQGSPMLKTAWSLFICTQDVGYNAPTDVASSERMSETFPFHVSVDAMFPPAISTLAGDSINFNTPVPASAFLQSSTATSASKLLLTLNHSLP